MKDESAEFLAAVAVVSNIQASVEQRIAAAQAWTTKYEARKALKVESAEASLARAQREAMEAAAAKPLTHRIKWVSEKGGVG